MVVDGVVDWGIERSGGKRGDQRWWWEPFFGDNPYLAKEYRQTHSPAMAYDGLDYTEVPVNWDLQENEQINIHLQGWRRSMIDPPAEAFPDNIDVNDQRISFTGPLDLSAWSRRTFPDEWAAARGHAPFGLPAVDLEVPPFDP